MKFYSSIILMVLFLHSSCKDQTSKTEHHEHFPETLETLSYTLYSDQTELFVEFKPLVVGSISRFATHLTILGETFLPLTDASVTVSLVMGDVGIRNTTDSVSSPGIFKLALKPKTAGIGQLIFDIKTKSTNDQIIINNIEIYPDEKTALEKQVTLQKKGEITYLKEQAWKVNFANTPVVKQDFFDIIKTNGHIRSAASDEHILSATASGTLLYSKRDMIEGVSVQKDQILFSITGGNNIQGNIDAAFLESKSQYEKAKKDFERNSVLAKDRIVSEKELMHSQLIYENSKSAFQTLAKNYGSSGQKVKSPMLGFVKNIHVSEGQYVELGTPLVTLVENQKIYLQAFVTQRHFDKISLVRSAHFKIIGSEEVFNTSELAGRIIAVGKNIEENSPFIPLTFEINNAANIISGASVEVFLKSAKIPETLTLPVSAMMEDQGHFYVFVQTGGERFEKREVLTGASDGISIQIISGLSEGERVVTKGAYHIKLASASGALPAHGHEH